MTWSAADPLVHAAIMRFAREGFGAALRAIAEDAGVSPALLIKRFGSKAGLRETCDDVVLEAIRAIKHENISATATGQLLPTLTSSDEYAPLLGYALQSVLSGGPLGRAFIEHMIDDAHEYTADAVQRGLARPSRDEHARVRYLVLSGVGAFLLTMLLDPPEDTSDLPGLMRRLQSETGLPMIELFTEGLFTTRQMLDDYLLYVSDPPAVDAPGD
ncbi:MAG: TetR family transcriptional regulator [Schumannella sp.]